MITLRLHRIAASVHFVSATLLCIYANHLVWLIINEILTCLSHTIGIVIWTNSNDKVAEYTRRWTEFAITAGLLEAAMLQGVPRIVTILTLNAVLQLYGFMLDRYRNLKYLLLAGFIVLAVEIGLIAEWTTQPVRTTVLFAVLYSFFGIVQLLHKYNALPYDEDHVYTVLSITTKIILTWSIVAHEWSDTTLEFSIIGTFGAFLLVSLALLPRI